ncbi:MAG: DUF3052 domain-containing protein [Actinomycetota bacterium]|nr:DUF3052 domain-containing protein [Actinomycetota bacterium]MDH5225012.1 DUF3052 domain-containing protein [Actinomycetota bacterium]MDH5313241.1 DUF3052 domain-containing protein [Actinomycetota bacterium]
MAEGHKDYSATPLWKKLGIRRGSRVVLRGAPDGFDVLLELRAPLPPEVVFLARATARIDVAVVFTTERRELARRFPGMQRSLDVAGRLWIAWPKKASGLETDLSFAVVQAHGLAAGLVDNKTASITDEFQGCQFVRRVKDR